MYTDILSWCIHVLSYEHVRVIKTPLTPHFHIVKFWFIGGCILSIFCSKHRSWVHDYANPRSMFWAKIRRKKKKQSKILNWKLSFLQPFRFAVYCVVPGIEIEIQPFSRPSYCALFSREKRRNSRGEITLWKTLPSSCLVLVKHRSRLKMTEKLSTGT